jgi:putative two-component system response regulator
LASRPSSSDAPSEPTAAGFDAAALPARGGPVRSVRELLDDARAAEGVDPAAARSMAQQARVLARQLDDPAAESEALYRLASLAYSQGHPDDAFSIALEAREMARRSGATVVEVWSLNLAAIVHYQAGNFSEALASALHAVELYRLTDHHHDEGNLLNTVAVIHHSLGDTDRALVTYEAALTANKGLERPEYDVLTLTNMAEVRAGRNEHLLAIGLAESAVDLAREHSPVYVPDILGRLANSYAALGSIDRAMACLAEADEQIAARDDVGTSTRLAVAMARGATATAAADHAGAVAAYRTALEVAVGAGLTEPELHAHTALAKAYKAVGDFERALSHQELRFERHEQLFSRGTDLRIKTLQIAHDTEAARQQAEILRLRTGELEALVKSRTYDLEEYQLAAFERLAVLAEFRNTDPGEHPLRVGDIAARIAAAVADGFGLDEQYVDRLRLAGRLHDIGKVAVPDTVLLKPGPLTVEEFELMKTHTVVGGDILSGSNSPLIQLAAEVARTHHERWDGTGYPRGLRADEIPISGRIVTIADVYDALVSVRTYKGAWAPIDAIRHVVDAAGSQFQPRLVAAFLRVMRDEHPALVDQIDELARRF